MGFGKLIAKGKIEVSDKDGKTQVVEAKQHHKQQKAAVDYITMKIDGKKLLEEKMVLPQLPRINDCGRQWIYGVEFAYFYNSMGTKVTIVEFMQRIVPVEDEDISKELEKQYKKNGVTILTNSEVTNVDTSGAGVKATVKSANGETVLEADILLSAVGVAANIEGIGLEALGVKTEKGRIKVDKYGQTNVPGIYAIGDCSPGQALAHVASKEGIVCVEAIAYNEHKYHHQPEAIDYNNIPGCTYCVRNCLCWLY
jgi:dihydrolipoamide dehydrogenase